MDDAKGNLLHRGESIEDSKRLDSLEDIDFDLPPHLPKATEKSRRLKLKRWIIYISTPLLFWTLLGLAFLIKGRSQPTSSSDPDPLLHQFQYKDCGASPEEARNIGCVYSFIPGAWVPPACHDIELEEEFLAREEWRWYADKEFQHEITADFIRQTGGPPVYYTNLEYHFLHCAYTWKKLHRAVINRRPIDAHVAHYEHTVHCADGLATHNDSGKDVAQFGYIFTSCKPLLMTDLDA